MKMVKDGWHEIRDCEVYVEDGYVIRAIKSDPYGGLLPAAPYKRTGHGWVNMCRKVTLDTLRSGIRRGSYRIH